MSGSSFDNPFGPELLDFLRELAANNRRDWFNENKERYELELKEPALAFISGFGSHLAAISPYFLAIPKATGGSLFRIYRDTRFGHDKRPYKTHLGIQFRHRDGKDVHTPGFYLHVEPGASFVGLGVWRPDGRALGAIRRAMVAHPDRWRAVRDAEAFASRFSLGGESLQRAPRGFDPEHPLIEDLKREDFIASVEIPEEAVLAPEFPERFVADCRAGAGFVRYLAEAVGVPF